MILSLSFLQTGFSLRSFLFMGAKNPWLDGQGTGKAQRLTNFITKTIYLYIIPRRSQTKKGGDSLEMARYPGVIFPRDCNGPVAVDGKK